MTHSYMLLGYM